MKVTEAVKKRRSIRGFKPDPVPETLLREILDTARYAPSNCNTQPWHLTVVSGEARQRLQQAIFDEINAGKAPYPYPTKTWRGSIRIASTSAPWIITA